MSASNGSRAWLVNLAATLAGLGIAAAVGVAIAQRGIEKDVEAIADENERNRPAIQSIPVIQAEIRHIKEALDDGKKERGAILTAIKDLK